MLWFFFLLKHVEGPLYHFIKKKEKRAFSLSQAYREGYIYRILEPVKAQGIGNGVFVNLHVFHSFFLSFSRTLKNSVLAQCCYRSVVGSSNYSRGVGCSHPSRGRLCPANPRVRPTGDNCNVLWVSLEYILEIIHLTLFIGFTNNDNFRDMKIYRTLIEHL